MDSTPCPWLNNPENNINKEVLHKPHETFARVYDNIVECIGNTPMIRLNKIPQSYGLKCEILVKCEFLNPGGSTKDRIAQRMIEDSEKLGFIKPGYTLVEATSGNTGIGLAMVAAVKGYNMITALPEKMSQEKINVLKGFGTKIIRTPNEVSSDSPESHISVSKRTRDETPNAVILDQYNNSSNPGSHYDHTGQEIVDQCQGKLDVFVAGVGTGGTITGCSSKIKELIPNCKCIGVDPQLSTLATGRVLGELSDPSLLPKFVHVEGIGYDFVPNVCVKSFIDEWVKTDDVEGFTMARRLIREEGLLVGGSAGSAVAGAIKYAQAYNLNENHRIVVLLADSVRNYINKFLNDDWMIDKGFFSNELYLNKESKLYGKKVRDLGLEAVRTSTKDLKVGNAFQMLEKAEAIPIIEDNKVLGLIHANQFIGAVQRKKLTDEDTVLRCICKDFISVEMDTDLSIVQKFLEKYPLVVVEDKNDDNSSSLVYFVTVKNIFKVYNNK